MFQQRKDLCSLIFHIPIARQVKFIKPLNRVIGYTEVFEIHNTAKRLGLCCEGRVENHDRYFICINFKLR